MEFKNFYYSVEFFSRDVLLPLSGLTTCLLIAISSDAHIRQESILFFLSITWIQLFIIVGTLAFFAVAWGVVSSRCFNMFIWHPLNLIFLGKLDYSHYYQENSQKIGELFKGNAETCSIALSEFDEETDLRLRMNILLYLVQLHFPHGYVYLQRLWGIQSMIQSMCVTSLALAVLAFHFCKATMLYTMLALSLVLIVSYGRMVYTNTNEELKVLAAMTIQRMARA